MKNSLQQLVEISNFYGRQKDFVIAGGGNTSFKNEDFLFVKASGISLGSIDESGFVKLDRSKLGQILSKTYPEESAERELQVKSDLLKSRVHPEKNQRPSVEASVHDAIHYPFVVHLHPTVVNGLTCSVEAKSRSVDMFKEDMVFLEYITPGYILFKTIEEKNREYYEVHGAYPKIFILQNHGIFVGADSVEEIREIYSCVIDTISNEIDEREPYPEVPVRNEIVEVIPAIRAALSTEQLVICEIKNNTLVQKYTDDLHSFQKISRPFTPDGIVYCNPFPLYVENDGPPENIVAAFEKALNAYRSDHGYDPKIVLVQGMGMIATGESHKMAQTRLDVFEDVLKIADYSESFGGPNPMTAHDVEFIEKWEVEAYRKKMMQSQANGKVENKVAVVTGGAQGFGKGIVEGLAREGANVVILDINEEKGREFLESLNKKFSGSGFLFIKTDITNSENLAFAVQDVVRNFGGIDLLVSNAGVLHAGGLDELDERHFDMVTNVNYKGYYLCVKHFSRVMKLQAKHNQNLFSDIIQINSKSGLQGSNRNFAYAGGKFGGIGLTQSFAMELVPYRIKVNAICPGNYFEGPLWDDPERGLFVQYLRAGKVPGAQSITDVKTFYEEKVPMKRGCSPEDVLKAILYIIEQKYETGQAVPVTGGQTMLH